MKHFNPVRTIALTLAVASFSLQQAHAQLDSCNVFLKGKYVEVGINTNAAFGSSVAAPAGYHPKGGVLVGNTCYPSKCVAPGTNIGFVADPAKDGWTVGSPPYFGDYFLPGDPQEGWSIQADDSLRMDAWNGILTADVCGSSLNPFQYSGSKKISSSFGNTSYSTNGKYRMGVWHGIYDSLDITQTTIMDTTTVFFTMYVQIENISSATKHHLYYLRTVDPDNDEPEPGGGFTTNNSVTSETTGALVSATGQSSSLAYLGLGTLDCRAKAFIINVGLMPNSGTGHGNGLDAMYGNNIDLNGDTAISGYPPAPAYQYEGSHTQDQGIGLVFKLDSLLPGQCTSLAYAYILRQADLAAAFLSTKPRWTDFGDTASYITGDTAVVCKNSIVTMNIVNGGCHDWTWYSLTGNYISPNTGTVVNVQVDTTPAQLMAIGQNGSCIADTIYMTILPTIAIDPQVTPVHYCVGNPATPLTARHSAEVTLHWYRSNDPADTGSTTAPTPSTDSVGVFTYYVTGRYKGCLSNRVPITVTVDPPPPTLVVSNNGPLCLNERLSLTATTIPSSVYTWTGPNGFSSSLQNPQINAVVAADSGLYTVTDSMEGCPLQRATTNVLVDNVFSKVLSDKRAACVNDTLTLNFGGHIPDTNSTIQWDFAGGTMLLGDPTGQSKGPYIIRWDTLGRKLVTVTAQNWRCVSKVIDTIPVVWAPTVMFDMPKDICIYDTVKATVSDYSMTNADSLTWDFSGGSQVGGGTGGSRADYYVSFGSTGQKVVKLTISYPQCIRQPYTDTVQIRPLPDAQINAISRTNICEGDTVTFTAVLHDQYRYTWAPEKQVSQTSGIGNSEAVITILQTGYIYMSARDKYNCVATDSMDVKADACCAVSFPSAFTPNGDGRNDVFRPITVGNHHVKIFRIVNRYGQTVFQSNIERQGWDGKLNGVPQDMGTYFYFFSYECNGKTIEEKGDVILIR